MDKQRLCQDLLELEKLYIECASSSLDDPNFERDFDELLEFLSGFLYRMSHEKSLDWYKHSGQLRYSLLEKVQHKLPFFSSRDEQTSLFSEDNGG